MVCLEKPKGMNEADEEPLENRKSPATTSPTINRIPAIITAANKPQPLPELLVLITEVTMLEEGVLISTPG
jgi:hypothetical protein